MKLCRQQYYGPHTGTLYECTLERDHTGYHYDEPKAFDWWTKRRVCDHMEIEKTVDGFFCKQCRKSVDISEWESEWKKEYLDG